MVLAVNHVPGFSYDANGDVTNDAANTYAYNVEGRPMTVNGYGQIFDAFDRLVESQNAGGYTSIVYSPDGYKLARMNGSSVVKYMAPLAAGMQAVYTANTPAGVAYWRHADWLGSSRLATTVGQTVYYDGAYAPFGESYAETGTTDRDFTGQTQDTTPGLYDFLFRQQSSAQGRWLVPDPAGLAAVDITNPQTWNRYAYVANNPLSNTDPLGLDCVYVYDNGSTSTLSGDCASTYDNGYYVNGTVTNANYNSETGGLEVTYDPADQNDAGYTVFAGAATSGLDPANNGPVIAANSGNCGTTWVPRSFGVSYGGNVDAGAGYEGISATGSVGVGVFYNGNTGGSTGAFAGGGATAYFFNGNVGAPKQQGQPFNFGGYAGGGPSVWFSNAGGAPQLRGPFTTWSLNVGAGLVKGSLQLSYGGGIWQLSIGPPVSPGTPSVSISKITTKTTTTSGCH